MTQFEQVLNKVDALINGLKKETDNIEKLIKDKQMRVAYEMSLRIAEQSEQLTLLTRSLPAYTGNPNAREDIRRIIANAIRVDIGYTIEGWFSIRIPALLPKKSSGSASYIRSYLYPAMQHFFSCTEPMKYSDCVLIFRHVYSSGRPERQYRDHDNIEINMVIDIVAMYVMTDDAPLKCCHYYCSAIGQEDRTEIYVVPQNEFVQWLLAEKVLPQNGEKLYHEYPKPPQKDM